MKWRRLGVRNVWFWIALAGFVCSVGIVVLEIDSLTTPVGFLWSFLQDAWADNN